MAGRIGRLTTRRGAVGASAAAPKQGSLVVPKSGSVNIRRAVNGVVATVSDYAEKDWPQSETTFVFSTPGEIKLG